VKKILNAGKNQKIRVNLTFIKKIKVSWILITGGSGFVGKKLADCLIKKKNEVYVLDRFSNETCKSEINFITGDIRSKDLDLQEYDIIYHLASVLHPISKDSEESAWDINVNGTKNILEKLNKNQHIIFSSSSHVYDITKNEKHKEDEKLKPWNFYGLTKMIGENMVEYYSHINGFSSGILRFFNIYGTGQVSGNRGYLIPDIIEKYKTQKVIDVLNPDGEIDMVFIDDLIELLVVGKGIQGVYNVGYGKANKISEVYKIVKKELNANPKEILKQSKGYSLLSDTERIKNELGWNAKTTLEEGLKKTIEWHNLKN